MNDEFFQRLLKTFKIEAAEHIKTISEELLNYEKSTDNNERSESINTMFRGAHSLKGAARAVSSGEIESYCQTLESIFAKIRDGLLTTSFKLIDEIHRGIDCISNFLQEEDKDKILQIRSELDSLNTNLLNVLNDNPEITVKPKKRQPKQQKPVEKTSTPVEIIKQEIPEQKKPEEILKPVDKPVPDVKLQSTIRVTTDKMDKLFLKSEEMLSCKLESDDILKNLTELKLINDTNKKIIENLSSVIKLRSRENSSSEMNNILSLLEEGSKESLKKMSRIQKQTFQYNKHLSSMVSNLVDEMKEVLMLPFSYLSDVFPKMVRELARDLNKEIEFEVKGGEIEIDRRILEEMKDAMIHLIRNSVDHGIESPEVREKNEKNRIGKITLEVNKEGGDKIEIILSDDGAGINFESIRNSAVRKNLFSSNEIQSFNEEQLLQLLFHPHFSTSQVITDISGRGVGMSVVKEKMNRLNGTIKIFSQQNKGTTFKIILPLTLAKIRAVILRCSDHIYAMQTLNIDRVTRIKKESIKTVQNRETITYDSKPIPLCSLSTVLGIPEQLNGKSNFSNVIVVKVSENIVAFKVDEILHEQEIIIKKLNRQLENINFINGATILGNGRVIPVLNTHDLLRQLQTTPVTQIKMEQEVSQRTNKLLIADDSVTSRMLLRDILESAGYKVKMVIDGKEAFAELKSNKYDLVISDVEMPRVNGFELTKKIRADAEIKRLPVILLTSLANKEDREKGIDAGANAYIVKSGFDQTNLLDTIDRLI